MNKHFRETSDCVNEVSTIYNLVLVDDERLTIKSLAKTVKWENFGFKLCGVFDNGFDCIDYIKHNSVDAVISDIRMPQMDGVMLARRIIEWDSNIKIVLASAYKDFDYAVQAVRLKVFDYIVKPYNCRMIEEVLQKLADELQKEYFESQSMFLKTDEDIRIQKLIRDFIDQKNRVFLEKPIVVHGVDIRHVPVVIMKIELLEIEKYLDEVWQYGITGLYNALNNIIGDERMLIFPLNYAFDHISFVLIAEDMNFEKMLHDFSVLRDSIVSDCFELLNLSVNVDMIQASACIEEMVNTQMLGNVDVQKQILISAIKGRSNDEIIGIIARFCEVFADDEAMIRTYFISVLNELVNQFGTDNVKKYDENYSCLFYEKHIDTLKQRMEQLCVKISKRNEYEDLYDAITIAKNYVTEHLEEGFSIAEVAEAVSLSPAYFGRVFKEKTGGKFLDYVNKRRIEAAQKYLTTTGMKISEIYERVGYRSRNYFYSMFRDISGCTPQEYRAKGKRDE